MRDPLTDIPHVVRDFYIGHTHIIIADNYCRDKTPEEVDAILKKIARDALTAIRAAAEREKEKAEL